MNKKLLLTVSLMAFFASASFAFANLTQIELQPQSSFTCNATGTIYYSLSNNQLMLCTSGSGSSPVLTSSGSGGTNASFSSLTVSGITTLATASGNVGIGTTAPNAKLDVEGGNMLALNGGGTTQLTLGNYAALGSGGSNAYLLLHAATTIGSKIMLEGETGGQNIVLDNTGTQFGITGGNVGINTTSPGTNLDVNGNINVGSVLYDRSNTNYYVNPSGNIMPYAVNAGGAINSTAGYYNGGSPVWVTKSMTLSNGPGWYRIISSGNQWLNGTIRLYGTSGNNQVTDSMFSISQNKYNHQGSIQVLRAGNYNGSHIANLRLGADGTGLYVDVQFAGISNPTTLYIDYAGQISGVLSTPVFNPTTPTYVGAQMPGTAYGIDNGVDNPYPILLNPDGYGNIGIGTSNPTYLLDVNGGFRTVTQAVLGTGVAQGAPSPTNIGTNATLLLSGAGGNYLAFGQYGSSQSYGQWIQSAYSNPTTATYNLILQPLAGSVGIGTASPNGGANLSGAVLDIGNVNKQGAVIFGSSDGGSLFYIQNNNATSSSSGLQIAALGNAGMTLNNGGTLSVSGNITANSATFSQPITVGTPTSANNAATKSYVDSAITGGSGSSVGYWTLSGSNLYTNSTSYNVGIGTTTPGATLQVAGTVRANTLDLSPSGGAFTISASQINRTDGYVELQYAGGNGVRMFGNTSYPVTFLGNGSVGIGTTNPGYPLQIGSGTVGSITNYPTILATNSSQVAIGAGINNKMLYIFNNGTTLKLDAYDYAAGSALGFSIGGNGGGYVYIGSTGNVGINTASPGTTLDVNGNTQSSIFYDRDNTNYYIDPAANTMPYSANLAGSINAGGNVNASSYYSSGDPVYLRWEAANLNHNCGASVSTSTSVYGVAWSSSGCAGNTLMTWGPYYNFPVGNYRVVWRMEVTNNTSASNVVGIAFNSGNGNISAPTTLYLKGTDFPTANNWYDFSMPLSAWGNNNVEFYTVYYSGTVLLDDITVVPDTSYGAQRTDSNLYVSGNIGIQTTNTPYALSVAGSMYSVEVDNGTATGATTIDWSKSNTQTLVLGASPIALTFSNGQPGAHYTLALKQDATGSRTVTWPGNVRWSSGVAPTLTTTANKTDYVEFVYDGLSSTFDGVGFNANF